LTTTPFTPGTPAETDRSKTRASLDEEILGALRRIIRSIGQHSHSLAKRYGLTGPQLAVLQEVASGEATSVSSLAMRAHLS
jgi:hypothetical protein